MLSQYQTQADADEVDLELVVALLRHLCSSPDSMLGLTSKGSLGAILVFLPGKSDFPSNFHVIVTLMCHVSNHNSHDEGAGYSPTSPPVQ